MYIRLRLHEVRYARNRYVVITRRNEGNGGSLARADNIDTNLTAVKRRRFGPDKKRSARKFRTGENRKISVANRTMMSQAAPRHERCRRCARRI